MVQYKTIAYGELHTTGSPILAITPLNEIIQRESRNGWKLHSITPMESKIDKEQGCGCLKKKQIITTNLTEKIIMLVFVKEDITPPLNEIRELPSTKQQSVEKTATRQTKPKETTSKKKTVKVEEPSITSDEQEKINLYSFAKQQMDNRSYQAAYNCFIKIKGYKDVDELIAILEDKI